jgi:hypothetical protein
LWRVGVYGTCDAPGIWAAERQAQARALRHIIGNSFRPVAVEVGWRTPALVAVAQAVYNDRWFEDVAVPTDALEEAGGAGVALLG